MNRNAAGFLGRLLSPFFREEVAKFVTFEGLGELVSLSNGEIMFGRLEERIDVNDGLDFLDM